MPSDLNVLLQAVLMMPPRARKAPTSLRSLKHLTCSREECCSNYQAQLFPHSLTTEVFHSVEMSV